MTLFVRAVDSALLDFIWQGLVVAFVLWIALAALRRSSANARYLVSCLALGVLTALPVLTACLAYHRPVESNVPISAATAIVFIPTSVPAAASWSGLLEVWLLPVWSCGVLLLSVRLLWGCARVARLKRQGDPAEPAILDTVERLAKRIHVERPVRVLISTLADGPSVAGWARPVLLLPAATILGLPPEQLEAVLAHELAHIQRYDYLVNLIQMMIETLFFYHPAVWWISGRIRQEREVCCDDIAVRCCGDAVCYARALAALERMRTMVPSLALGANDGPLMYRVQRLLGTAPSQPAPSRLPGIVAICVAFACFTPSVRPVKAQVPALQAPPPAQPLSTLPPLRSAQVAPTRITPNRATPRRILPQIIQVSPAAPVTAAAAVTVEVTVDRNGDVSDARVLSGPQEQRRSALLMALGMHFPQDAAPTTRQLTILANTPPFERFDSPVVQPVMTRGQALERITGNEEQIVKLRALQEYASEKGAKQLQEAIDAQARGIKDVQSIASGQNPLVGTSLENIRITGDGVTDEMREQLLLRLPVRLHDILSDESMAAAVRAVLEAYPRASAYFGTIVVTGQAALVVTSPKWSTLPVFVR